MKSVGRFSVRSWPHRFLLAAMCITAAGPAAPGQGIPVPRLPEDPGNRFSRFFYLDYVPPRIQAVGIERKDTLAGRIREGKIPLTAEDAVRLAMENNLDISVERFTPYFNVWGVEKGRGILNPSFNLSSNLDRLVTPSTSALQGGTTLLNLVTVFDATFKKPFEKGFDLEVGFNARRLRSSSSFASLNPSIAPALKVTFTQHLLRDFGSISRARNIRIARNTYGMSTEDFVRRATDVLTDVLNSYWNLVFAQEDIVVKEASKKLAEVVLEQNRIQAQIGTMSELDVIQAEAEVATRNEQLITSRYTRRIAEENLKKLLSNQQDPGVLTAPVEPLSRPEAPSAPASDVTTAIQRALEIRPEIRRLQLDRENKKVQVEYTRNQLKPTLDLVATYSQNGVGGLRIERDYSKGFANAPVVGTIPGGFGDALDSLFSQRYLGYYVGLTLKIPIGNDEARANNAQARIDYQQVDEKIRAERQKVALEIREAYHRVEMDQARVESAEVTVRYTQRKLDGEQDKFSLGASTTRFILEAQRDLQDAQTRLLLARIGLIKSRIALDKAIGDIFATYHIDVEDALRLDR